MATGFFMPLELEWEMVEIIDVAGVPGRDYQDGAGGIGINVVKSLESSSTKIDTAIIATLNEYITNCVYFELARPGTTLTHEELTRGGNNYLPSLAKAVNPSITTLQYTAGVPEGQAVSCTVANTTIQNYFTSATFAENAVKSSCTQNGFDITNPAELAKCKSLLNNTLANVVNAAGVSDSDFVRQASISKTLYNVIKNSSSTTAMAISANRSVTSTGIGMGIAANEWLPIIKAIMTAISIGLLPFLILFIPTPLGWKAISTITGLFVFLAVWGVTDAVCHGAAMDYAAQVFGDLQISNLSLEGMINFPDLSTKTVAMFGQIRTGGIMLASVITMMLVKFGGSAMAHMAGGLVGGVQTGGKLGGTLATPEGKANALNTQEKSRGSLSYHSAPNHDFDTSTRANANAMHKNVGANAVFESGAEAQKIGTITGETTKGEAIGKNIANANAGESNVSAAAKTAAVKQTQNVADARKNLQEGGLSGIAGRQNTVTQGNIGSANALAHAATENNMTPQQQAYANKYVETTIQDAKSQAELNDGNLQERAQRNAALAVGASAAVAGMFRTNEGARQFGQRLKQLDLNSSEGRMQAAQDLQSFLAADGVNFSLDQAQQAMARGTTLKQSGGSGAYIGKTQGGANKLINAGQVTTATGVGAAKQIQANAAAQGTSLENYGSLGKRADRNVSFNKDDDSSALYQKMQAFKEASGLQNMQIPDSGFASAIHYDQDGHIVGIEGLTSAGSGSSRSFDTDTQNNLASQQQVTTGLDGQPVVSKTEGNYRRQTYSGVMADLPGSNDYNELDYTPVSDSQMGGIASQTVGPDNSGHLSFKKEHATMAGETVFATSDRGDTTNISEGRVNILGGANVDGLSSMTAGKGAGSVTESVTSTVAGWFGESEEDAQALGAKYGKMAEDYTKLGTGTAISGAKELKQLGFGRGKPSTPGASPATGNTTQQTMQNWKEYFKRTGDIAD